MKILLTGGGTGGHIVPVLAVITEIRKMKLVDDNIEFMLIVSDSEFNKTISDVKIQIKTIKAGKLRRYFSWENFTDVFKIIIGFFQSLYYIYKFRPDIVFSKGGFASIPPVIASYILKIPIITHESDIAPGLANKIIARFADKIFISFEETKKYFLNKKTIFTGNPIRKDILNGDKNKAREIFDLKENIQTILIFGGSQGAKKINEIVLESLSGILKNFQVIHICGSKNYEETKNQIKSLKLENIKRYKVYPFLTNNLKDAYALCNVVVSRAGANSLSEIIALKKASIIIPLPGSANNHQFQNAKFFADKKMLIMIKESDLTSKVLIKKLFELLQGDNLRLNIIQKIKKEESAKKNATELIAKEIINYNQKL